MNHQTFKELWWNDELELIEDDIDDGWRHGNNHSTIFKHGNDYWNCNYRVSGDGEYHGIRENEFDLTKVYPIKAVTRKTYWTTDMPNPATTSDRYIRTFHEVAAIQFPKNPEDAKTTYQDIISGDYTNLMQHVNGLEAFENWFERNDPEALVMFKGNTVEVVSDGVATVFPAGTWFVKEPHRGVYGLSEEIFQKLFEKA